MKRFIEISVPVTTCNLRCHYCYISQQRLFSSGITPLPYSISHIRRALSRERLGGVCLLNLCGGGETLLPDYMFDLVHALLEEGHYVMIVTNGTVTKRIREMVDMYPAELKSRLIFKFSFHYLELKKRGLLNLYFDNVRTVRDGGCSFSVEIAPSDELIPYIDDVKRECMEHLGALCHVTVARDERRKEFPILTSLTREDYIRTWSQFDSQMFDYKIRVFGEKRREFCYSGLWGGILNLATGEYSACYRSPDRQNIMDDPDRPIEIRPVGRCNCAHCFNAHARLALGMIPELEAPVYADMRDRVDSEGRHWLQPAMRAFLSQRLDTDNALLSDEEKCRISRHASVRNLVYKVRAFAAGIYHRIR